MKKNSLVAACFALVSMLALGHPANAQLLFFGESLTGASCFAPCSSVTTGQDPVSGLTTLEYILDPTLPITAPGDFLIEEFGSSTIGDVLRFENNLSGDAAVFVYSNDVTGGLTADVGLPPSFLSHTHTLSEDSNGLVGPYTMTASDPGGPYTFTFEFTSTDVPEPSTLSVFISSCGLLLIWRMLRRSQKSPQAQAAAQGG